MIYILILASSIINFIQLENKSLDLCNEIQSENCINYVNEKLDERKKDEDRYNKMVELEKKYAGR